ncbi:MAG: glycosyltransferase family 52, partial [Anaerovoracaceae bacterium]
ETLYGTEMGKIAKMVFDEFLEEHFAQIFINQNFENTFYVYNDYTLYYYYLNKYCKKIVGVESGYGTMNGALKMEHYRGRIAKIEPFVDKYFPKSGWSGEKVIGLISSKEIDDELKKNRPHVDVFDFIEIVNKNKSKLVAIYNKMFSFSKTKYQEEINIYATQPLGKIEYYCTPQEKYIFDKKLISNFSKYPEKLIVKPHPADDFDYMEFKSDKNEVLDRNFPIELLSFNGIRINKLITVSSSSSEIIDSAKEKIVLAKEFTGIGNPVRDAILNKVSLFDKIIYTISNKLKGK